ncbi:halomucin [Aspergillus awamori]|uniref:Halomucin n=1 Tax=Aspergillus awamori TaxID=105351 RepID=A0A401L5W9_ASPAW|nr:halomucin [Aspergillus awamori]GKZ59247.1 hypothetical protein AnigIFM49718_005111 [Aspergillus niger]
MNHVEEPISLMDNYSTHHDSDMDMADGLISPSGAAGFIPTSDPSDFKENRPPPPENEDTIDDATDVATEADLHEAMEDLDVDTDYEASESEDDSEEYEEDMDDEDRDSEEDDESVWDDDDEVYDPDNAPIKDGDLDDIERNFKGLYDESGPQSPSYHHDDDSMEDLDYEGTHSDECGSSESPNEDMDDISTEDQDEYDGCAGSDMDMSDNNDEGEREEEEDDDEDEDEDSDVSFPGADYLKRTAAKPGVVHILGSSDRSYEDTTGRRHVVIKITTYDPPTLIRVPVKPLVLSSDVFAEIFGYVKCEGVHPSDYDRLNEDKLIWTEELSFNWPNPAAMLWVLQTLTKRWPELPECVDLAFLKDIAEIVNRFELGSSMDFDSFGWPVYAYVRPDRTVPSRKELLDWVMFITWVFRSRGGHDFRQANRGVIMDFTFKAKPEKGLLPRHLYESIHKARLELYQKLAEVIRGHLDYLAENQHEDRMVPCAHHISSVWEDILKLAEDPKSHRVSPSRIHLKICELVESFEKLVKESAPGCPVRPLETLLACEKEMRRCQGINCDGKNARKTDICRVTRYGWGFNFKELSWPCPDWVGVTADRKPRKRWMPWD